MNDFALNPETRDRQESLRGRPPLRPAWLHPLSAFVVIAAHVSFFAIFMYWVRPQLIALGSINAELVREGDIDAELAPEGDSLEGEPMTEAEAKADDSVSESSLPPPLVMEPDTTSLSANKEDVAKVIKVEKKRSERRSAENASASHEARVRRRYGLPGGHGQGAGTSRVGGRYGVPGGRGQGSGAGGRYGVPGGRGQGAGASQATCLAGVAAATRQHMPGATSLGPGTAYVTFYVNLGGGISVVSATGSTPAHASLARRLVAPRRMGRPVAGPPSPVNK